MNKAIEIEEEKVISKEIFPYDPAEDLLSDEGIAYFIEGAFETNDPEFVAYALGVAARAKGMALVAKETGLSREQLSQSFSKKGNPTLRTTLSMMKALGIRMSTKGVVEAH